MHLQTDYFPVLNIQQFSEGSSSGCNLLFHELRGERSISEPHKHDFFIIILFEKGKGTHTIDFVNHPIKKHQIHLLFPGQVHQWEIEQETLAYQLMIGRAWFERLLPSLRFPESFYQHHPVFEVPENVFRSLLHEFRSVQEELNEKNIFWELIQSRSQLICLLVSKTVESSFKGLDIYHSNPIITQFLSLIDRHFKSNRSVSFYAGELNLSANYLNIVCKKNLKVSASSLIQDRVLLEAKRLLKVSEMSVKGIVYQLGFYDHSNFSKFFKAQTGMSPSQFKKQL